MSHFGIWALLGLLSLVGCSTPASAPGNLQRGANAGEPLQGGAAAWITESVPDRGLERLAELLQQRRRESLNGDYSLGPGDLVQISVPGMEDLKDFSARISGENTLALPYLGTINIKGVTEKALREEIRRRLAQDFMHNPQVALFIKEARSRQVAVIGAVNRPGLYDLASPSDTIFAMISQAGGMRADAAERILFVPAEPLTLQKTNEIYATLPAHLVRQEAAASLVLKGVEPIVINLDRISRGGDELYLVAPARPGDILMIPGGGEFFVQGWVEKPGAYKISSGITILGAVAAAGGPMYPADIGSVRLIRTEKVGSKISLTANLSAIQRGEEPDLRIQEGDVVDVGSSSAKLVAYGFYRFFTSMINVGASIPLK